MDLFFAAAPVPAKRRVHFHAFMLEIHGRLDRRNAAGAAQDPLAPLAERAARARPGCSASTSSTSRTSPMR